MENKDLKNNEHNEIKEGNKSHENNVNEHNNFNDSNEKPKDEDLKQSSNDNSPDKKQGFHEEHHNKDHNKSNSKHNSYSHKHKHKIVHMSTKKSNRFSNRFNIWKLTSIILLLVLVLFVSIAIYNANSVSTDKIIKDITKLESKLKSQYNSESIYNITSTLNKAKRIIKEVDNTIVELESNIDLNEKSNGLKNNNEFSNNDGYADDKEKVNVEFYVMSQCPYGTQVENAIAPVIDELGNSINFSINYIVTETGNLVFNSLHGEPEVKGNIVQLCAMKYSPNKYLDLIVCMNKNPQEIPDNWQSCADEANMNKNEMESIKSCYESDEGKELLSNSAKKAQARNARGSPTIYINDNLYTGARGEKDFMRAICSEFKNPPKPCKDIPPPKTVNLIYLTDKRCNECNEATRLIASLKSIFPGLNVTTYDYNTKEGKALYENAGIRFLPAFLFDETVKEGEGYANVQRYLTKAGDYLSLMIGAKFDPTREICDNGIDDTGNGKIDCEDNDCANAFECREEIPKDLKLFVMSQCPFGIQAMNSMKEVLENFGDGINFSIYYIASENPDGTFTSLHGQPEVDENIRELCAMEYYPDNYKYMDYIWCRNKNIKDNDWESCAEETGLNSSIIRECFESDEGKKLLSENIKLGNDLGIGSSPTWIANNVYKFSGIDAETIKNNYCKQNPGLEGCSNTLTQSSQQVSGGCGS